MLFLAQAPCAGAGSSAGFCVGADGRVPHWHLGGTLCQVSHCPSSLPQTPPPTGQVTREPSGCTPTSCPQSPGQEPHPSPKMPPGCRSRQSWEGGGARLLLRPSLSLTPPSSSPELRHARFNMAPLCWREAAVLGGMAVCPHGPRGSQSPAFRACPQPRPGDPTFRAAWGLPRLQLSVGPRPLPRPVTGLTHLGPRPPRQLPARPLA